MSNFDKLVELYNLPDGDEKTAQLAAFFADTNLNDLRDNALDAWKAVGIKDKDGNLRADVTDEDIARAEAIAQITNDLTAKIGETEKAAAERADRLNRLAEADALLNVPAPEATSPIEVAPDEPIVEVTEQPKEPALVASKTAEKKTAFPLDLSALQSSKVIEVTPTAPVLRRSITAAADIPGVPAGQDLMGLPELASIAGKRFAALQRAGGGSGKISAGIASIERNFPKEKSFTNSDSLPRAYSVIDNATNPLKNNNLTAAGWCAPSTTIYDLCDPAQTDGLWDVPELGAPRGGVRFPAGLDLTALYSGGWHFTEVNMEAGVTKPCITVDCPDFTDVRLDVVGICLKSPILTAHAFPELLENFMANALAMHVHRSNEIAIEKAVALSEALTIAGADVGNTPNYGAATTGLEYTTYAASWIRYRHRLGANQILEAVFPLWAKEVFRADLAKKNGVDLFRVSDAELNDFFAVRNIRIQWVYDWQDAMSTATATAWGGTPLPADPTWPATVSGLIYPAGTFVKLSEDVLTLDGVYDSTLLATNDFTQLWTEEGMNIMKKCYTSIVLTFPVCVNGLSGAQSAPACSNMPAVLTEAVTP